MANSLGLLFVGVVAGAGLGAIVTATVLDRPAMPETNGSIGKSHDHSAHDHGGDMQDHQMIEAADPVPTLAIKIHPDGPQSRNLEIITTNFTFDPTGVNGANKDGHGHAHIYINNVKQPRTYAPWVHLSALPKGTHEVRVTLNANDHSELAKDGVPIEAIATLTIE